MGVRIRRKRKKKKRYFSIIVAYRMYSRMFYGLLPNYNKSSRTTA